MQTSLDEKFYNTIETLPITWQFGLARNISNLLCPPVTIALAFLVIAYAIQSLAGWLWVLFCLIFVVGVPVVYVFWQVHIGKISDFHIPIRSQRLRPTLMTIACMLAALAFLWSNQAPGLLVSLLFWGVLISLVMLLITLYWKISGHAAAISALSVLLIHFLGPIMIATLLLIPLVSWARVYIRRHTAAQTVAGALLGIVYIGLVLLHQ